MSKSQIKLGNLLCSFSLTEGMRGQQRYVSERHCNAEYEYFIILSGKCRMDIEDREFFLSAADGILIPPKKYHVTLDMSEDFSNIVLPFFLKSDTGEDVPSLCGETRAVKVSENSLSDARLLRKTMSERPLFYERQAEARFTLILTELLASLLSETTNHKSTAPIRDERLDKIDDFFERYANEDIVLSDLAKDLHLSARQTSRVLYRNYGMGFCEKRLLARMDKAAYLLRTTLLSVSKISEKIGYLSENSFFKAFKKIHGVTPIEYRREHRQ